MTKNQKQIVKDDIAKYEKDTGNTFRTANYWERKKGFYDHRVTFADVTK